MNEYKSITVMISEDEPLILNNITKKVELVDPSIEVIGVAENGKELLKLIHCKAPDIVITDIEMPGINGLELIQILRERYPQIQVIILSGYNNFEYARTAMRLGVEEYLSKPVSQEEISTLLKKLSTQILKNRYREKEMILKQALSKGLKPLQSNYDTTESNLLVSLITIGNLPSSHTPPIISQHKLDDNFNVTHIRNLSLHISNIDEVWVIEEPYKFQKCIIFQCNRKNVTPDNISSILYNNFKEMFKELPFHMVVLPQTVPMTHLKEEIKKLRQFTIKTNPLCSQNSIIYKNIPLSKRYEKQSQWIDFTIFTQCKTLFQSRKYVRNLLISYLERKVPSYVVDDLIYHVYQYLPRVFSLEEKHAYSAMEKVLSKLHEYSSYSELCDTLENSLTELYWNHSSEITVDSLFGKIQSYITHNYKEKITMNLLSHHFGYSSSYINRIYKKIGGVSPIQYVTELRIGEAKKILHQSQNLPIQSIAQVVGYEDAQYFSRVFKAKTGMSPSEWASLHK